jgi:hypothetical protein
MKLLRYLFPIAALTIAIIGPSRAQAPQLAVCKDHVCVMSESDYKRLQAFVERVRDYAEAAQKRDEEAEMALNYAQRKAESCMARLNGNRS